eukprot:ctg_1147.g231
MRRRVQQVMVFSRYCAKGDARRAETARNGAILPPGCWQWVWRIAPAGGAAAGRTGGAVQMPSALRGATRCVRSTKPRRRSPPACPRG